MLAGRKGGGDKGLTSEETSTVQKTGKISMVKVGYLQRNRMMLSHPNKSEKVLADCKARDQGRLFYAVNFIGNSGQNGGIVI